VIRGRREALFLTQREFANRCDLHRTYVSAIERGERNLSLQNIIRIAQALEIRVSELFRDAEDLAEASSNVDDE